MKENKHFFKLVLIGDASVGKSSIIRRLIDNEYKHSYIVTLGVDFVI